MFTETLLESSGLHQRSNRGWSTAASVALQVVVIGTLALVPMLYPDAMSLVRRPPEVPIFSAPPAPPVEQIAHPSRTSPIASSYQVPFVHNTSTLDFGRPHPEPGDTTAPPDPNAIRDTGIPGTNLINIGSAPPPVVRDVPRGPVRISRPDPASLVHYVKPIYPHLAVVSRTQGTVTISALISKEGNVESVQLVSGHPLLARSALEAVRQWRYRPYILNGEPVEVETQITVNFIFGNN